MRKNVLPAKLARGLCVRVKWRC